MVRSSMISVNLERSMNFITVHISISHICTISFLKTFKEEVTVHIEVLVELVKTCCTFHLGNYGDRDCIYQSLDGLRKIGLV